MLLYFCLPQVSKALREVALTHTSKSQLFIKAFARALEVIPRQLCNNAGFDATDVLNKLRQKHAAADASGRVGHQERHDAAFFVLAGWPGCLCLGLVVRPCSGGWVV